MAENRLAVLGAFQFLGEFVASGLAAKPPIVVPVLRKPANAREGLCYLAPAPKSETHPMSRRPGDWPGGMSGQFLSAPGRSTCQHDERSQALWHWKKPRAFCASSMGAQHGRKMKEAAGMAASQLQVRGRGRPGAGTGPAPTARRRACAYRPFTTGNWISVT
jgi:hypothetical protein